jgi:cytidylate kinase
MIIAIDGVAASGKGTIARAVAGHFQLPYLDTGLLYRAIGITAQRRGVLAGDAEGAVSACDFQEELLADPELRTAAAGALASQFSSIPGVRAALLARQREFACRPGGAVLDGRDIGTVIAPDADAKLFVTASPEERARRRFLELGGAAGAPAMEVLLAQLIERDNRDMTRSAAPLLAADDATLLDTSHLTIAQSIESAIAIVAERCDA